MKKHKIAVALVCVVFFTGAQGAIAASDEEQRASIPIEDYAPADYFPEWYQPGDTIPCFSPDDPYSGYDNRGTQPLNSGVGVPEPRTVARWGGVAGAQERPDTAHTQLPAFGTWYWWLEPGRDWSWWHPGLNSYEWWLGGAPPPFPFPEGLTPRDNIPAVSPGDPYPGYRNLGTERLDSGVAVPEPGSCVLLGGAGLWLVAWSWRKRRRR